MVEAFFTQMFFVVVVVGIGVVVSPMRRRASTSVSGSPSALRNAEPERRRKTG
jgi:hypothetical protein